MESDSSLTIVLLAMLAGAIRVSTPFLFVSLGECLTEKSGRINLGLEGTLVFGAMTGYAISYHTGSPWLGVLVAGIAGSLFGALHGYICKLPKVNDIAIGIALMLFGTGLAFYFGKPFTTWIMGRKVGKAYKVKQGYYIRRHRPKTLTLYAEYTEGVLNP